MYTEDFPEGPAPWTAGCAEQNSLQEIRVYFEFGEVVAQGDNGLHLFVQGGTFWTGPEVFGDPLTFFSREA
jgi:hypothetical protein